MYFSSAMTLAAEPLGGVRAECREPLLEEDTEVGDGDSSSSLSVASWDSDSETDGGPEPSEASVEDEVTSEAESCLYSSDSKRRRLAGARDCSQCWHPSFPAASHTSEVTLQIFDWDDTLLPSTWLQQQGLQIGNGSPPPSEEQKRELRRVARRVIKTLRRAKRLGHLMIVTNGEKGWVELSCCKFLPEVFPLLEGIEVLSARSTFEHVQPQSSPLFWKRLAFRKEIATFFEMPLRCAEAGHQRNIISVGDSKQERAALFEATDGRDCWTKSLKLMERPSISQLLKQHDLLHACLRPFVDFEGSLDLCLDVPH